MEEHLVAYVCGTLDPVTRVRVEAWLESSPDAMARLVLLEQALEPLAEDACEPEPPADLVASTLALVAMHRRRLPLAPRPTSAQRGAPPRRWARPIDWLVAACLLFLVGGLTPPLLARLWQQQQRMACANNLRGFWVGLQAYSDQNANRFPQVEARGARGVAGIFVPLLADAGLIQDVRVACPGSGRAEPARCTVAELEKAHREQPEAFRTRTHDLAGDYAYSLGYQQGAHLCGLERHSGDHLPILADCSSAEGGNSGNHGGGGQNVLYVGGQVRWCALPTVGEEEDNIFLNRHLRVQAGVCRTDSVLAASHERPLTAD